MKFFATIAFVLAIAAVSNASVSDLARPVLEATQPLASGLDNGLKCGASQIQRGVNKAGAALNSVTSGVGNVAQGTVSGLGNTLADLPGALEGLTLELQHAGIVGNLLDTLLGCSHRHHRH